MKTTRVTVHWQNGLHLRPATRLVQLARAFQSRILLRLGERAADARSILQLVLLSASLGTTMIIEADGRDENEVMQAMTRLFLSEDADEGQPAAEHVTLPFNTPPPETD